MAQKLRLKTTSFCDNNVQKNQQGTRETELGVILPQLLDEIFRAIFSKS